LSFGQFFGNHFGNVATHLMDISSVNIIKSTEPIITMIMMFILFGQKQSLTKIILIFPIIIGICLCNEGNLTYSMNGTLFCLLSNFFHIIKIIISKKYFSDVLGYTGNSIQFLVNSGTLFISLPIIIKNLFTCEYNIYLLLSCFGYYYNSLAAFELMSKVNPVTFSVLNIYKRIIISIIYYVISFQLPSIPVLCGLIITNASLYISSKL